MRGSPRHPATSPPRCGARSRRGVAAVELAVLLPFLLFIFVAAVDFGRVFYYEVAVTNCALSGALYGSTDATHAADTQGIQAAAKAEAPELSSILSVSSTTGTDSAGNPFVAVKVTYLFQTITNFPGIPSSATVSRTVQMRVNPNTWTWDDD
jgi:Flp pilus assembly protein TadG